MTISAALVLFAVIWFMTLFVVLPLRHTSQSEAGEVVPGTPASAPSNLNLKRKMRWVTVIAVILWVPIYFVIVNGWIPVSTFNYGVISPVNEAQ